MALEVLYAHSANRIVASGLRDLPAFGADFAFRFFAASPGDNVPCHSSDSRQKSFSKARSFSSRLDFYKILTKSENSCVMFLAAIMSPRIFCLPNDRSGCGQRGNRISAQRIGANENGST
jgi:hypothetical protein